jgi:hypothetical protein
MSSGQDGSGTDKSSSMTTATATATATATTAVAGRGGVQEEDGATVSRTIRTLLSRQDLDCAIKDERQN